MEWKSDTELVRLTLSGLFYTWRIPNNPIGCVNKIGSIPPAAMRDTVSAVRENLTTGWQLSNDMEAIGRWDELRQQLRIGCREAAIQGSKRRVFARKRRIRRLRKALTAAMEATHRPQYGLTDDIESIEGLVG